MPGSFRVKGVISVPVRFKEGGVCVFMSVPEKEAWPVCQSFLENEAWPLGQSVPEKEAWPLGQ